MIITSKVHYGLRALIEISSAPEGVGVFQKDIAVNQNVSNKYLDHIIKELKTARLVINHKGKKGGYRLCLPPNEITVYMIYRAFEPELCLVECLFNDTCARTDIDFDDKLKGGCHIQPVWKELNKRMIIFMNSITLKDILDGKDLSQIRVY